MKLRMKSYSLETTLTFGKYKGKTVKQIVSIEPSYINWCVINNAYFYIEPSVIAEIEMMKRPFKFRFEAKKILKEKSEKLEKIYKNNDSADDDDNHRGDEDNTDWSSYDDNLDMDQQSSDFWNQF